MKNFAVNGDEAALSVTSALSSGCPLRGRRVSAELCR